MPTRLLTKGGPLAAALALLLTPHALRAAPPSPAATLAAADDRFAFRLFHALTAGAGRGQNVFVSPSSIALALTMTYTGAGGATRAAMARALSLQGLSLEQVNAGSAALQAALKSADPDVRLTVTNDLWADTGTRIDPAFARNARRYYSAGVTTLRLGPGAAAVINARIGKATQGKISDLLSRDDFAGPVHTVLTDAVYFHGPWSEPFEKGDTRPGTFTRPDGSRKTLPLMERTSEMAYYQGDGFQEVSLAYGRGRFTLDVLLPAPASSLSALLKSLDAVHWETWNSRITSEEVDLTLPRFKVTAGSELNAPLMALGMGPAFGLDADFHLMSRTPLHVSEVRQKAVLDVDENGTTATAATAVMMSGRGMRLNPAPPAIMRVDRPFLCVLRDRGTGAILFMGAITDPQ